MTREVIAMLGGFSATAPLMLYCAAISWWRHDRMLALIYSVPGACGVAAFVIMVLAQ